jgi:hypothetical protein
LIQQGLGLAIVDVVASCRANLHRKLLERLGATSLLPPETELYAASYRPVDRDGRPSLDIWQEPLAIGETMPSLPLWLRGAICLHFDLAATYDRTCREQRILVGA